MKKLLVSILLGNLCLVWSVVLAQTTSETPDTASNTLSEQQIKSVQKTMIPPVRSGSILPGPRDGKNGLDYVEKSLIPRLVNTIVIFVLSAGVLGVIISGGMYLISSGDNETTKRAKEVLFWTLVGTGVVLFGYAIVKFLVGINFGG